jgi:hypothetical protein
LNEEPSEIKQENLTDSMDNQIDKEVENSPGCCDFIISIRNGM